MQRGSQRPKLKEVVATGVVGGEVVSLYSVDEKGLRTEPDGGGIVPARCQLRAARRVDRAGGDAHRGAVCVVAHLKLGKELAFALYLSPYSLVSKLFM